jgi:hypothetical protein
MNPFFNLLLREISLVFAKAKGHVLKHAERVEKGRMLKNHSAFSPNGKESFLFKV